MSIYFVYSDASRGSGQYFAYFDFVLTAMERAGARVMEEEAFAYHIYRDKLVSPDDKVVGFFMSEENSHLMYAPVKPENRWVHIDERATKDGLAYQGRIEYCRCLAVRHAVVTYQNVDHLKQLDAAGISHVVMPCCAAKRRLRTFKPNDISIAGSYGETTYALRMRLKTLLEPLFPLVAPPEPAYGHAHYDGLDTFQLGVTCRVGFRDRMVAKYVEMGMCHVLPIGDCPSYMPDEMKRLMVNVEGMTDEQVVTEVKRLLSSPEELFARQEAYCEATHVQFDLLTNAKRVIQTIRMM